MADLNIATLSGDYAVISESAVADFRGSLHGGVAAPWRRWVRRRPTDLERHDRQTARPDRPLQRNGRRDQLGELR